MPFRLGRVAARFRSTGRGVIYELLQQFSRKSFSTSCILQESERMAAYWRTFFHGMPMVFARPYTSSWQPFLPNPGDPASFRISTMRFLASVLTPLHSGTVLSGLIVDLWANREF